MQEQAYLHTLQRCRDEISHQRATIEHLTPKAQAWDQLCKVLNLLPQPQQGYGEDLVWRLDKQIEEITANISSSEAMDQAFGPSEQQGKGNPSHPHIATAAGLVDAMREVEIQRADVVARTWIGPEKANTNPVDASVRLEPRRDFDAESWDGGNV